MLAPIFTSNNCILLNLLNTNTIGAVCRERAAMFILDSKSEDSNIKIKDIDHICYPSQSDIIEKINHFLFINNLSLSEIDSLMLCINVYIITYSFYPTVTHLFFPITLIFS